MKSAPDGNDEDARLRALHATEVLDTDPEPDFDGLTFLATQICGAPIGLISLVDRDRQWFKSRVGMAATQTPRDVAFCAHAILGDGLFEVQDALRDERFADNPLVLGETAIRFYAGAPIRSGDGHAFGTVCVIDQVPRALDEAQKRALVALARQASVLIEQHARARKFRENNLELRRLAAQLAESEAGSRATFEATAVGMAIVGLDGRFRRANAALCRYLGYAESELLDKSFKDVMHPDEAAAASARLLALSLKHGESRVAEKRYVHKTGRVLHALVSTCCVFDEERAPLYLISHVQDISERKEAEAATARSLRIQARLAAALEETRDLVAIVGEDAELQFLNRAGRELLGVLDANLPATLDAAALRPAWALARQHAEVAPALGQTGRWSGESAFSSPTRGEVPVVQSAVAHRDAAGNPAFTSVVAHDISEQRLMERMKDHFVATVSHELRTPLTCIHGALDLLDAGVMGPLHHDAAEVLRIAKANCARLLRLVNDILDLEKTGSGKLSLTVTPAKPRSLVQTAVDGVRAVADDAGVRLTIAVTVAPTLHVDVDRIHQVLTNLLSNAIKVSARGESVDVLAETPTSNVVRFAVVDRGPGIPKADHHRLFQPFQQLDATDGRKGGTGLGLAISKEIVELHGGRIGVDSDDGQGCTFWFEVPVSTAPGVG